MIIKNIAKSAPLILFTFNAIAEESKLKENTSYRLEKSVEIEQVTNGCNLTNSNQKHAGKASKFEVIKKLNGCDIVRFWSVYYTDDSKKDNTVTEHDEYILPSVISGVPIDASTTRNGRKSGLLVVPYKYRGDDGSITGEATVGYYAGWQTRYGTYIASAGLSQVSIPVSGVETENQSAVSVALGFLISNWDNIDLGFVVGIDHIGGSKGDSWQYENDPWYSLMIGWNFSQ